MGGSRLAFDRLCDRYVSCMRLFLSSRVSEPHLEDVMQEVWIAAWTAMPQFRRSSQFKTWLFSIAVNKVRDFGRSQARRPHAIGLDHTAELAVAPVHAAHTEVADQVRSLLQELPDDQREVVELYYLSGLNLREIATALDRNLNTVKYQFYRGLTTLEAHIRHQEREATE